MSAPRSLRVRIVLAALAAVGLIGLVTGAVLLAAVERDGRKAVDKELRERAQEVGSRDRQPRRGGGDGPGDLLRGSGAFTQIALGPQLLEQRGDVPQDTPLPPLREGLGTIELEGEPWRTLTFIVPVLGSSAPLRLQVASTLAPVEERVASIRRRVVGLGLVALAITAVVVWLIMSVALRPLARLREGAERVSGAQDLGAPLTDDHGPVEVRSVAAAINAMLERLRRSGEGTERALQATRRFAADAGHELRTPLTGLRANLEALERNPDLPAAERQDLVAESLAVGGRMVHLLEGLQALARGEAAESLPREHVELTDLVEGALFAARRRHPRVVLELDLGDGAQEAETGVHGWEGGLRLLVDNLVDNAALHGRPGGRVRVGVRRDAGEVELLVEDDGPGIAASQRAAVLEPFARGAGTDAPGTGLGLAIVVQQVALHGGRLELTDAALGGLGVRVRLPAAAVRSARSGSDIQPRDGTRPAAGTRREVRG